MLSETLTILSDPQRPSTILNDRRRSSAILNTSDPQRFSAIPSDYMETRLYITYRVTSLLSQMWIALNVSSVRKDNPLSGFDEIFLAEEFGKRRRCYVIYTNRKHVKDALLTSQKEIVVIGHPPVHYGVSTKSGNSRKSGKNQGNACRVKHIKEKSGNSTNS